MKWNFSWFWRGFGSALSLDGYQRSPETDRILNRTPEEAMAEDWRAVGDDLRRAMQIVEKESRDKERHHDGS